MQPYALTLEKFLVHAAKWHPHAEVVTGNADGTVDRIDYASLYERAVQMSAMLAAFGVAPGDRVATLAWNTRTHVEIWYAVMGMGAVCHTLNPRLTADDIARMVEQSAPAVLAISADLAPLAYDVVARSPSVERLLVIDGDAPPLPAGNACPIVMLEEALGERRDPVPWGDFDENAPCGLCFTSGTTGSPKGVTYTHRGNYLHTMRQLQADVSGFTSRDAVLTVVPMFHANAWGLPFSVPAVGGKLVLPGRQADGASLADLIDCEAVTIGVGVPTVWLGLMDYLDTSGRTLPSLSRVMVGGSPISPALADRMEQRGISVQLSWGMTELSPLGTAMPPDSVDRSAALSGRPAIGIDLLLADADGEPLPEQRGGEGRLLVRGPSVVDRYFGQQGRATDEEGWFDTGDLARIDGRGYLQITGRSKDLIKSGGEWINPAEIEAIVGVLPEVSLAAVVGQADEKWGERPVLIVEIQDGCTIGDEALLDPLKDKVASWWIPEKVFRIEQMPLAVTGKIDKMRLRADYCSA